MCTVNSSVRVGIPLYPELRNRPAPSAPRILEIFNNVQRHQRIKGKQQSTCS